MNSHALTDCDIMNKAEAKMIQDLFTNMDCSQLGCVLLAWV